ncbi:MAG: acyl-CoA mutase large subunit family protein [Candidatus Hodarchaeales archaeon]|jgi:methylmalonyl-CoA mutase N-terminal domain/subunit
MTVEEKPKLTGVPKTNESQEVALKKKRWEDTTLKKALEKFPERQEKFVTTSSQPVGRLYTPAEIEDSDYLRDIGFPGEFPYTRGVQPSMYRGRLFTMRQFAGFGSAEETNARFKYLLENGQTGLSVAFHLPTLYGYDSDAPMAEGEVGKCGVAIDSLKDMEILFEGIPLDEVSTSMTINSPAAVLLAMYQVVGEKQGVPPEKLRGTMQNDILKEYIAQKEYIFPPEPSMRLVVDTFEYCSKVMPQFNTISISGYHIREAGSTAAQELAFTLADGFAYVDAALTRGLKIDDFAPRLSYFFNCHNDFFEEIAKFRAARRIWARIMKEKYGATGRSLLLRFHTQTAGCSLSAQQPEINVVRVAIQALAAVMGGTQSLHTNSMDEALALPTEEAVRIALRTQQIIAHESGVTNTIDPLGGSYFVEALTNEMEKQSMEYFHKIETLGGVIPAIEKGFFQREIADSAFIYQKEIDEKKRTIIGVNNYILDEDTPIPILRIDPELSKKQCERLKHVKATRNNEKVQDILERLRIAAKGTENLMPIIVEAVREYATVQEICDVFRDIFGEYEEPAVF